MTIQHETLNSEATFLRNKLEELALRAAELEEGKRSDDRLRQRLNNEKSDAESKLRAKEGDLQNALLDFKRESVETENHWKGIVAEKDLALGAMKSDLRQAKDRLSVREQDLARMNDALNSRDLEVKKVGESHSSDRMALKLEVERLHRDLAHYEADLDHAKAEVSEKEEKLRQGEMEAAMLVRGPKR